jgi:site-specific recombinase XerD
MRIEGKTQTSVPDPYRVLLYKIIVYHRVDYQTKDGKSPIMLEVNMHDTRVRFNTGIQISAKGWDPENFLVKKNYPKASDLNLIIRNCKARISDIFVRYRLQLKDLTPDLLRKEYLRPSVNIDFLEFMDAAILERRGELTESSLAQHRAHLNKLRKFRQKITFSELTEDFFVEYQRWLKNNEGNGQNTRWNSIKTIRTYINIAKRKKLIEENPLTHMPVKQGHPDRGFLDECELQRLVDLYRAGTLPDNYQRALRHYLFCCFTSIRISDLKRIQMEDIISDILILMPYKTKNVNAHTVRIPLNKFAIQLIKDESPYRLNGFCFTPYSEPRSRLFMKDVFVHAKIYQKLSFHSSRHTFATIFLKRTKNLAALQKILGHSKIEQTMIYAHCLTADIAQEMKVMDQF